jgi:retron-type reverse transcriptase
MRSWSNKVLSVRKVTQDNRGKATAGVDGIKSLSPEARLELIGQLKLTGKSKPTRRVWIPKPGKDEKRPLGIPTIHDRKDKLGFRTLITPSKDACKKHQREIKDAVKKHKYSPQELLIGRERVVTLEPYPTYRTEE